jgi:hypothetical protein
MQDFTKAASKLNTNDHLRLGGLFYRHPFLHPILFYFIFIN